MLRRSKKRSTTAHAEPWRAPIVTDHLIIREAVAADSVAMQATMDHEVRRESGLAEEELRGLTLAVDHGLLHVPTRMICEIPSGLIIGGVVTFANAEPEPPRLWMWLAPDRQGIGYERETLVGVVEHLHDFGTPEITVRVRSTSTSDLETVESAGFRRTGDATAVATDGEPFGVVVFEHSRATPPPGSE